MRLKAARARAAHAQVPADRRASCRLRRAGNATTPASQPDASPHWGTRRCRFLGLTAARALP